MIRLSGFADEVTPDFRGQLEFLRQAGMKYIEIRFVDGVNVTELDDRALQRARALLTEYGIGVSAVASPIGKVGVDEPFEPHFEKFRHTVDLARHFGTNLIRVFSFYPPKTGRADSFRSEVIERLKRMCDYLDGSGIKMAHENESHIYGHSAENCVDLVRSVASEHLTLAYDPANFVWGDAVTDNVERCFPLMEPYVTHVHIKDWKSGSTDVGSLPGEGDGQIELLIERLARKGYAGFVTLEPHMNSGGQFGGETRPEQFLAALANVKKMCDRHQLKYE